MGVIQMKKHLISALLLGAYLFSFSSFTQAQQPDYEKYGKVAMAVVIADYPGEEVRDYKYLGRNQINDTTVEDSFRFQVQENSKKVNVLVKVSHTIPNNKTLTITVVPQKQ
jgi:hypothetical protein